MGLRRGSLLVAAGALVPLLLFLAAERRVAGESGFPLDDSWIHLHFARNLAEGRGFAYNPGVPVAGSTAPLWTLLLGLAFRLAGPSVLLVKVLGVAATVLAALLTPRAAAGFGAAAPAGTAAGLALLASIGLFRPAFALACEPLLWLMYAVRWRGGGERQVPAHGPCLVIANHACWGDPLFLEKVLPRPTTPMMTSRFYDLPVLRFWMRHFGVIRVPEQPLKKETPEVQEAIAALERGECLVIFPEGYLRRREEQPLRRFGRGIWLILRTCPQVPIFACWIEGNWGSYTSYWNGPPTKNKRPDFRRPIRIAITGPHWVPAAVLADHWQTRFFLMDLVDAARQQLGLPPLGPFASAPLSTLHRDPGNEPNGENGANGPVDDDGEPLRPSEPPPENRS